jgi:uncharacterized membrane protein YgdD (TMEM256/DUF423 family)
VETNIQRANDYVLAVVLFSISLFFAALSTRLRTFRLRATLLGMGYLLFVGTVIWLATQPVIISI